MLAAYECFGDWEFWNLSAVAKKLLGATVKRYRDIVDKGETLIDRPFKELVDHACADADIALRLYAVLTRELRNRQIENQFFEGTMRVERFLLEREYDGVRVDTGRMTILDKTIRRTVDTLRTVATESAGCEFDIDSTNETTEVLRRLGIWEKTARPLGHSQMEQIAGYFLGVKNIVRYRHERNRSREIEAIRTQTKKGRVLVSFSQIKNSHGTIHASSLNLTLAIKERIVLDQELVDLSGCHRS